MSDRPGADRPPSSVDLLESGHCNVHQGSQPAGYRTVDETRRSSSNTTSDCVPSAAVSSPINSCSSRAGMPGRDRSLDHSGTLYRTEMLDWINRLSPVPAAVPIAVMLAEERTDTFGAEISNTVITVPRQDDRIREHDLSFVDTALEIT